MPLLRRLVVAAPAAALMLGYAACGDDGTQPSNGTLDTTPAQLSIVSGNTQSGNTGAQLGSPFVVRVTNAGGDELQSVTIDWTVQQAGGSLGSTSSATNSQGEASNTYTLGPAAGPNQVQATVANMASLSVTFTATGIAPTQDSTPAAIVVVSGNNQSAAPGAALPSPLVVRVTNAGSDPLSGIDVAWTVVTGGGMLGSTSSATNAQGEASNTYTLGPNSGANQVSAAVADMTNINATFTATGVAGTGANVSIGDNFYNPVSVAVSTGESVLWEWTGDNPHTVTFDDMNITSSSTQTSGTFTATFPNSGTFTYFCSVHGRTVMSGQVVVN